MLAYKPSILIAGIFKLCFRIRSHKLYTFVLPLAGDQEGIIHRGTTSVRKKLQCMMYVAKAFERCWNGEGNKWCSFNVIWPHDYMAKFLQICFMKWLHNVEWEILYKLGGDSFTYPWRSIMVILMHASVIICFPSHWWWIFRFEL